MKDHRGKPLGITSHPGSRRLTGTRTGDSRLPVFGPGLQYSAPVLASRRVNQRLRHNNHWSRNCRPTTLFGGRESF